jgi:Zn-dependent peptidase ImmA (M78 family)/transcriptional regulator with XRE-family HTH domain
LTGAALADLVGIPRQSISAYENDDATPGPETAERIAAVLNLPLRFFLEQVDREDDPSPIYWRSRAAATKMARHRSQRRFGWLRRIVAFLSEYKEFPALRLPPALPVTEPVQISPEDIDHAARAARTFFGIGQGAIANMSWLLENHGVIVGYADLGASTLDSFSQISRDGHGYAIVNSGCGSSVRYRFDLAHELGHLVLHRNLDGGPISHSVRSAQMEDQAHRFAREFLMPSPVFAKNFYSSTVDGLKVLKRMWGVSMQAALMHATDLNLLSDMQAKKLWRGISARGWRHQEPLDDVIPHERPELLRGAFDSILRAGVSAETILSALPYTGREIESLCRLEPGTLVPNVVTSSVFDLSTVPRPAPRVVTRRDRKPVNGADVIVLGSERRDR